MIPLTLGRRRARPWGLALTASLAAAQAGAGCDEAPAQLVQDGGGMHKDSRRLVLDDGGGGPGDAPWDAWLAREAAAPRPDSQVSKPDVDPCAGVVCDVNAKCDPSQPTKCKCNPGYTGDGKTCSGARKDLVCNRYNDARAKAVTGGWTPGPNSCDPGTLSSAAQQSALVATNMFRFIAGQQDVTIDSTYTNKAQQCAVMMKENGTINHYPPTSWKCYTADGAEAARKSNLAYGGGMDATGSVYAFIRDSGNASTLGHRRWILGNWIGPTGFGTTGSYTCMWVQGNHSTAKQWVAWPPDGEVPKDLVYDSTGWSFQSDSIKPTAVEVSSGGSPLAVSMTTLASNYGSYNAISFIPQGWSTQAGQVYDVKITSSSGTVTYSVKPVTCP